MEGGSAICCPGREVVGGLSLVTSDTVVSESTLGRARHEHKDNEGLAAGGVIIMSEHFLDLKGFTALPLDSRRRLQALHQTKRLDSSVGRAAVS